MRRGTAALVSTAALAAPTADLTAVARAATTTPATKIVVVRKTVSGSEANADRWGYIRVTLVVKKTTTTTGTKKTVKRKIVDVKVPEYPDHTNRSVYINEQALPLLEQEVLQTTQFDSNIQLVSGATDTSYAFQESLQAAILKAKKV
jgi:uncharacterized protein with FMN-binding domain